MPCYTSSICLLLCFTSATGWHLGSVRLQHPSACHSSAGVYVEEGPDRDALTEALARENYLPVYLDPRTVRPPALRGAPRRPTNILQSSLPIAPAAAPNDTRADFW